MITVHFCIESFDPARGGMEESALRLMRSFANNQGIRIIGYAISAPLRRERIMGAGEILDIASQVEELTAPLGPWTIVNSHERHQERTRIQILLMRLAIRRALTLWPANRHLLLSFYLTTAGFVAQHVAFEFGLSHVACSRGSDLGKDVFTREAFAPVDFVLRNAQGIVTTNLGHAHTVMRFVKRQNHVHTIYNSIPVSVRPTWKRSRAGRVQLVSLCGYSIKKGTHVLLRAVAQLLEEGLPIQLRIAGQTGYGHWEDIRQRFLKRYGGAISMEGQISTDAVEQFLLDGDIYCSASLSEGCSNATMLAVCLGMPVVSTATGALVDLAKELNHVDMVEAGSVMEVQNALRRIAKKLLAGSLEIDSGRLGKLSRRLSCEREKADWKNIFSMYSTRVKTNPKPVK